MAKDKPKYKSKDPFLFVCPECGESEMVNGYSKGRILCKKCRKIANNESGKKRAAELSKDKIYTFECGCQYHSCQMPIRDKHKKIRCPGHGEFVSNIERHCIKCGKIFSCRKCLTSVTCDKCRRKYNNTSAKPEKISKIKYKAEPKPELPRKPDCKFYNYCIDKSGGKSFSCDGCIRYESKPLRIENYMYSNDSFTETGRHNPMMAS